MYRQLVIFSSLLLALSARAQQVVMLDYYFNHETHKGKSGQPERYHYMWEETTSPGFSKWGEIFTKKGFELKALEAAPRGNNLKTADIYIIVDPDSKKENPNPNYITKKDVKAIAAWVKKGGVLVMLANDSANVELEHFNLLAGAFGMHFNDDLQNHLVNDSQFPNGGVVTEGNPVFKSAKKIFMKDACSIGLKDSATSLLKNSDGATLIATTKYGKGTVLAVGDPWLYNEYTNGRLPAEYENDKAAEDITDWLKDKITKKD